MKEEKKGANESDTQQSKAKDFFKKHFEKIKECCGGNMEEKMSKCMSMFNNSGKTQGEESSDTKKRSGGCC